MDSTELQESQEPQETQETQQPIEKPQELDEPDNSMDDLTLQLLGNKKSMIPSFSEDIYGELYIVEFSGSIYKIVPSNE